jgi:hypothetical protein
MDKSSTQSSWSQVVKHSDFRELDTWTQKIQDSMDKLSIKLLAAATYTELLPAIKQYMVIQPFAVQRIKKNRNMWRLCFKSSDLN